MNEKECRQDQIKKVKLNLQIVEEKLIELHADNPNLNSGKNEEIAKEKVKEKRFRDVLHLLETKSIKKKKKKKKTIKKRKVMKKQAKKKKKLERKNK